MSRIDLLQKDYFNLMKISCGGVSENGGKS